MDALATPEQLADYTVGAVSAEDSRVQPMLDGASASIRRYCGWHITPSLTETITLDGSGDDLQQISTLYLTDVLSLANGEHTIDTTTLEWSENGSIRLRNGCFTDRFRGVTAEVTHGYTTAPDLTQVVLAVVARALTSPTGATKEGAGALAVEWAKTSPNGAGGLALLENELKVIDLYRL